MINYIEYDGLDNLVLYNCKRSVEQEKYAQVIKVDKYIIIKYIDGGIFSLCNQNELKLFAFKYIERIEDKKEIDSVEDVNQNSSGIYQILIQGVKAYLIVFRDLSAVMVLPSSKAFLFWLDVNELIAHVVKSRLLLLE